MASKKTDAMKALLRNPSSNKMLREALKSPIGSTSRAKAQKIFNIMNKLQGVHDGAGGPGIAMERYQQPQSMTQPMKPREPQPIVIFHKLPNLNISFDGSPRKQESQKIPNVMDGSGGPGYSDVRDGEGGIGDWFSGALSSFQSAVNPGGSALGGAAYNISNLANSSKNQTNLGHLIGTPARVFDAAKDSVTSGLNRFGSNLVTNVGKDIKNVAAWAAAPHDPTKSKQDPSAYNAYALSNATTGGAMSPETRTIFENNPYSTIASAAQRAASGFRNDPITGAAPAVASTSRDSTIKTAADQVARGYYPGLTSGAAIGPIAQADTTDVDVPGRYVAPGASTLGAASSNAPANTFSQNGHGSAAMNYSRALGISNLETPLKDVIAQKGIDAVVDLAIKANEGGSPAGVLNNPGNIKFRGLPGQIDSGVKATDGGTFASYATPAEGRQSIINILTRAASGQSPSYGTNPTLGSFADIWTNTGPGSTTGGTSGTGLASVGTEGNPNLLGATNTGSGVSAAVKGSIGPKTFALNTMLDPNDPVTGGKTAAQAAIANEAKLWDKFNIGGLQDQQVMLRNAGANLPANVTAYIAGRDQYLNQTDQMINEYVAKAASSMSSSADAFKAKAHLNYLYTLRGMQNKSYIDYLNSAVEQNKNDLQNVTDQYTVALNGYTKALTSTNALTQETYTQYAASLEDMYNATQDAPTRALNLSYLQEQILTAQASRISDSIKATQQGGYLKDAAALDGHITDTQGYVLPGIDLVNTVNQYAVLEPGMSPTSIITKYLEGVTNVLNADVNTAKTKEGQPITTEMKRKTASAAIQQFANFANQGLASGNANTYQIGLEDAQNVATRLGNMQGGALSNPNTAQVLVDGIRSLAPGRSLIRWFPTTPTQQQFVSTMTSKGIPAEVATAVYSEFLRYTSPGKEPVQNAAFANLSSAAQSYPQLGTSTTVANMMAQLQPYPGGTPEAFVQAMLNNMVSTSDRANLTPYTPEEVAQNVGYIYGQSVLHSALAGGNVGPGSTLSV